MTADAQDATEAPAPTDGFADGPTTETFARYRMILAAGIRLLALALAVLAASWIFGITVELVFEPYGWGFRAASAASAAALLLAAWILWQNADSLSRRALRWPPRGSCPACGFDLAGVSEARCPECGIDRGHATQRAPAYAVWHSALVIALRTLATFMLLWAATLWLNWLSYAVSGGNVWPEFSWLAAVALAVAKALPPLLLWRFAPAIGHRALRGCAAWNSHAPPRSEHG